MAHTTGRIPLDPNRRTVCAGVLSADGVTVAPLEVDANSNLLVSAIQSGTWVISPSVPTSVFNGQAVVATAGTRVQLSSNTCKSVTIKALSDNTDAVYVGNSGVTVSNGFELLAGDSVSLDIANTNVIYVDASANGDGISFMGVN